MKDDSIEIYFLPFRRNDGEMQILEQVIKKIVLTEYVSINKTMQKLNELGLHCSRKYLVEQIHEYRGIQEKRLNKDVKIRQIQRRIKKLRKRLQETEDTKERLRLNMTMLVLDSELNEMNNIDVRLEHPVNIMIALDEFATAETQSDYAIALNKLYQIYDSFTNTRLKNKMLLELHSIGRKCKNFYCYNIIPVENKRGHPKWYCEQCGGPSRDLQYRRRDAGSKCVGNPKDDRAILYKLKRKKERENAKY